MQVYVTCIRFAESLPVTILDVLSVTSESRLMNLPSHKSSSNRPQLQFCGNEQSNLHGPEI